MKFTKDLDLWTLNFVFFVTFVVIFFVRFSSSNSFNLFILRSRPHRAHDIDVARAHAEIAAQADAYFFVTRILVIAQQLEGCQDHPRRAKAALQRMLLLKCQLQRMERFVRADAFDSSDFGLVGLRGKEQTGAHRAAVEHHRASAADPVLTADVGSDQAEIVAQKIKQRAARLNRRRAF